MTVAARDDRVVSLEDAVEIDLAVLARRCGIDDRLDLVGNQCRVNLLVDIFTGHDFAAIVVNHFAVPVHHIVILDHVLAAIEVVPFNLGLGALDRLAR